MKKLTYLILFILLSSTVIAADLSDFPRLFTEHKPVQSVKGYTQSVRHVQTSMNILSILPRNIETINRIDRDRIDLGPDSINLEGDFILIGGPCQNQITKHFYPNADCLFGITDEDTIIKFEQRGQQRILVIASGSDEDLFKVSELIKSNPKILEDVNKSEVILDRKQIKEEREPEEENKIPDEIEDEVVTKKSGKCSACESEYGCLDFHEVTSINGKPFYCADNAKLAQQRDVGEACKLNHECIFNNCDNEVCGKASCWRRFVLWVKSIF